MHPIGGTVAVLLLVRRWGSSPPNVLPATRPGPRLPAFLLLPRSWRKALPPATSPSSATTVAACGSSQKVSLVSGLLSHSTPHYYTMIIAEIEDRPCPHPRCAHNRSRDNRPQSAVKHVWSGSKGNKRQRRRWRRQQRQRPMANRKKEAERSPPRHRVFGPAFVATNYSITTKPHPSTLRLRGPRAGLSHTRKQTVTFGPRNVASRGPTSS